MKRSVMSVKEMVNLYVTCGVAEETWNMLREMSFHGLISRENWDKFFETCKDWQFADDGTGIVDGNGKYLYKHDEEGFLCRVQ